MKIGEQTVTILKSFSKINNGLLFRRGNTLTTISNHKSVFASAVVEETFSGDFAIPYLDEFLKLLRELKTSEIALHDGFLEIKAGDQKRNARIYYADESMIVLPPPNRTKMDGVIERAEVRFRLLETDFDILRKVAAATTAPHLFFESRADRILAVVGDTGNEHHTRFSVDVGVSNGAKFRMIFMKNDLNKVAKGSYDVALSSEGLAQFKYIGLDVEFLVSMEQASEYKSADSPNGDEEREVTRQEAEDMRQAQDSSPDPAE